MFQVLGHRALCFYATFEIELTVISNDCFTFYILTLVIQRVTFYWQELYFGSAASARHNEILVPISVGSTSYNHNFYTIRIELI